MDELVSRFGYIAIFIGTFFEGETILVLGALAAHRGYLDLPWVVFSGFSGSLIGDQLWFYLARRYGKTFLERHPSWRHRTQRALALLDKYNTLFILSFRFLYGLRTVSSFAVGLTKVGNLRYLALNTLGAVVWAIALGTAGFLVGEALQLFLEKVGNYEKYIFAAIALIGVALWLYRTLRDRARAKRTLEIEGNTPPPNPPPQNVESN
jgi:membrane protein DedA with SNARE-associated domain